MNRAILIVICDFLVSAMLTMMTGMVPGHTGGTGVGLDENTTKVLLSELDRQNAELEELRDRLRETVSRLGPTPEREAELRKLTAKLAENMVQQSKLRASLAATPDNTGELDAKELQRRLETEQKAKLRLEIELRDRDKDLSVSRRELDAAAGQLRETRRDLAVQRRELSRTRESLAKTSEALVDVTRENSRTRSELARTEEKLAAEQRETRRTGHELSSAKEELRRLNTSLIRSRSETGALQTRNANLSGQLVVREKTNAELQDKLARAERTLAVAQLEKIEAAVQRDEMQKTVKSAVAELSAKERELKEALKEKYRSGAQLEAAQKIIAETRKRKNDVIKCYGAAVVQIDGVVREEALFGDRTGKSTSFYPLVDFGGKVLLVGLLNRFAGDEQVALSFKDVTEVKFTAAAPGGNAGRTLSGAMVLTAAEPRVAGFVHNDNNCTPLKLLTSGGLIRRGLEDLYLFKSTSFGGSSAKLDGRVSLARSGGSSSLFIRNAGRANNELKAAPGDFILSAEGEFVALVTVTDEVDHVRGARAVLFDSGAVWDQPVLIPLDRLPGEKYFSRYASAMRKVRAAVRPGYDRH
ncbi:MAG: hypothetical protein MR051_05665 [Lentisphaeria bacterium]|nr:hypothetical protein [Lentisphaeria bacterium]